MHPTYSSNTVWHTQQYNTQTSTLSTRTQLVYAFCSGLLLALGFAPFHLPGLAILSLALLFLQLRHKNTKHAVLIGFTYGLGYFGLGTSWIYNSIHTFGDLNLLASLFFTVLFVAFLSLYTGFFALIYTQLTKTLPVFFAPFLFASSWLFSEYCRASGITGFPWLILGFGQIDSPLQHLLPLIGVLGVSWLTALISSFLALGLTRGTPKKNMYLSLFVLLLILPGALHNKTWTQIKTNEPIPVGIIQANIAMQDKWDPALYPSIEADYQTQIQTLIQKNSLIVLPESSIPVPSHYAYDFLSDLSQKARKNQSAILLGIPHPNAINPMRYHNALMGLGTAHGIYLKQHLVPFGEYIPSAFLKLAAWIQLPDPNMASGSQHQKPVIFNQYNIATLICYEIAYPNLLRPQLPTAAFIVSLSDDGWFGHSFAMHQHLQMAQVLSKQTGRFQILANNNGVSSLIDANGKLIQSLPAFSKGHLEGIIYPATNVTPWTNTGNTYLFALNLLIGLMAIGLRLMLAARQKREYSNQPSSMC